MTSTDNNYHIPKEPDQPIEDRIRQASRQELEKWSDDPNCLELELCAKELAARKNPSELQSTRAVEGQRQAEQMHELLFDPRKEVSADAVYIASRIVKHLWIIFVLLPFVIALLVFLLK